MALTRSDIDTPLADGLHMAWYIDGSSKRWQPQVMVGVGPDGDPVPVAVDADGALVTVPA